MTELLIDAAALGDDSAFRGIGTYLRQLLFGLAEHRDLSVSALCRNGARLPGSVAAVPIRRAAPGRWRGVEHELLLPLDIRRRRFDVFHSPALDPPARCARPWVQTLHDVIPLVFDDPDLAVERRRWRRQAARYRKARTVIAISRHTAGVGMHVLGLDARRIEVIPHGVGSEFVPGGDTRPGNRAGERAGDAGGDRPYLLTVGEYSRRKGFGEAFSVAGKLAELGYPHRLHVAGRIAPWVRPAVDTLRAAAPSPDRIELRGFVDDLVGEYQRAQLLLMTSRYEGFGLPVLEAMACGTPVVAFSNSSITEVVGDAGVLVEDGDVQAMVAAVRLVLDDESRWRELSHRGIDRAAQFTWERSVAAHAAVYHSASY